MHRLEVQRFKPSGKYYDTVYFETDKDSWYEASEEFRRVLLEDDDDGSDHKYSNFHILLTGEGHDEGFPMMFPLFHIQTRQEVLYQGQCDKVFNQRSGEYMGGLS